MNGQEAAACVGLGLGACAAFTGAFGAAGAGFVLAEVIAGDSLAAAILGGIGAFGLNVGGRSRLRRSRFSITTMAPKESP